MALSVAAALAGALLLIAGRCQAQPESPVYHPIRLTLADQTITLTGHDLTLEQVEQIAFHGAKVRFSPGALAQGQASYDLLEEADEEGIALYGVNRGNGSEREIASARAARTAVVHDRDYYGARAGALPELDDEALVRAILVIQANHLPYNASSAPYMRALIELLNRDVTPVVYARGNAGEGDLPVTSNLHATLLGRGDAYFQGHRMKASEALTKAGLKPFEDETAKVTSNAIASAHASMLLMEGRRALEWSDLDLTMSFLAFNSSITPMSPGVQAGRPFRWVNWQADKHLEMLRDSYLMQDDPTRILQDAEGTRASYIRLGSAWEAWADLRDTVLLQINSREQNPSILLDAKPSDNWVLSTPWMMKYHVKGGPASKGRSGYIVSTANWDPYPMANKVEAFNLAFGNMAVTVATRIDHYASPFFTGIEATKVLSADQVAKSPTGYGFAFVYGDIWHELQSLSQSLIPDALITDTGVSDLASMSRLKAVRGRQEVDLYMQLLSYDLMGATYWMDVRKAQIPGRSFGQPATAAWTAFRQVVPFQEDVEGRRDIPIGVATYRFMKEHPASSFISGGPAMPQTFSPPVAK